MYSHLYNAGVNVRISDSGMVYVPCLVLAVMCGCWENCFTISFLIKIKEWF